MREQYTTELNCPAASFEDSLQVHFLLMIPAEEEEPLQQKKTASTHRTTSSSQSKSCVCDYIPYFA